MLRPGNPAPDLELPDRHGRLFRLSSLKGYKNVVLFFYPNDNGIVCTQEACAFRDAFEEFVSLGTVVIGVSRQGVGSHRHFAHQYDLPFVLLSDVDGKAREAYEVGRWMGLLNDRVTYVIDRQGIIRASIQSMLSAQVHVRKALKALDAQRRV